MNVYRVTYFHGSPGPSFIAAGNLGQAFNAAGDWASSVELLGELTYAAEAPPAGGRALTEEEIKATITKDGQFLVSLENGKKYRSLKKHLTGAGLTPDQYRAKWGLPDIYPMSSVGYTIMRRDMALAAGLGKKGKK